MKGGYAVIGLGRFGKSMACTLASLGKPVLAIDARSELVQEISSEVDAAITLDSTDSEALTEIGIDGFRCVVVGIGEASMEASILTTALLSQHGVPRIVARATHELHGRVLRAVGAHDVVNPEAEIGRRLANRLAHPNVIERVALGGEAILAEVETPSRFVGQTLVQLEVRNKYGVSVVAVKRGTNVISNPAGTETIQADDILVVIGAIQSINRLANMV